MSHTTAYRIGQDRSTIVKSEVKTKSKLNFDRLQIIISL